MSDITSKLVHGSNLSQKEQHKEKYRDEESRGFLREIRVRYDAWLKANLALVGPHAKLDSNDGKIIAERVALFADYKDFVDQQKYAEKFDSRSNLHSSILEEFMFYLFKDMVGGFGKHALLGKSHSFKDIFFSPPNYSEMLNRPYARIEIKDHDFVIGATFTAGFDASTPLANEPISKDQLELKTEKKPAEYGEVAIPENRIVPAAEKVETHLFDVPAVAIECKTYLDKTMLEGSSRAAEEIKARNPNGIYIVVMEWIKLTDAVNLRKYKVDQIYVLRKQKNTDREYRYLEGYVKNPLCVNAVSHLFDTVRGHLTKDWTGGVATGLERGWLMD